MFDRVFRVVASGDFEFLEDHLSTVLHADCLREDSAYRGKTCDKDEI